jgi:NAD(P)-dependent dehydrogenase (short-subunit alcohol dehydrogenase family)
LQLRGLTVTLGASGHHAIFSASSITCAKFALRGLVQSLARELWPQGVHVAHVVVDGIIGPAGAATVGGEPKLDPDHMAEAYWHLANQRPTAWTLELDLRPHGEKFFE